MRTRKNSVFGHFSRSVELQFCQKSRLFRNNIFRDNLECLVMAFLQSQLCLNPFRQLFLLILIPQTPFPMQQLNLSIYFVMLGIKMKLVINVCCIAKSYIALRKTS